MYLKLTGNQKIELTEEEAEKIQAVLLDPEPDKYIKLQGQAIKTSNIIGIFKPDKIICRPAYLEYYWTDEELEKWEREIFGEELENGNTFKKYLISERIIDSNEVVIKPSEYRMFNAKWNALNDLRFRKERDKGFPNRDNNLKEMKAKLINKFFIKPSDFETSLTEEAEIINSQPEKDIERTEQEKELLSKIPF